MDPKDTLHGYLRAARASLLGKLDGLGEYDVRRPMTPTGTNLLGLVKHVASVEAAYLGDCFGRPSPEALPWFADDAAPNADMWATEHEPLAGIVALYRRVWAHSDATVEQLPLDAVGRVPWWPPGRDEVTLHRILVHLIAETNRHAGHADVVRELVDGSVGLRRDGGNLPGGRCGVVAGVPRSGGAGRPPRRRGRRGRDVTGGSVRRGAGLAGRRDVAHLDHLDLDDVRRPGGRPGGRPRGLAPDHPPVHHPDHAALDGGGEPAAQDRPHRWEQQHEPDGVGEQTRDEQEHPCEPEQGRTGTGTDGAGGAGVPRPRPLAPVTEQADRGQPDPAQHDHPQGTAGQHEQHRPARPDQVPHLDGDHQLEEGQQQHREPDQRHPPPARRAHGPGAARTAPAVVAGLPARQGTPSGIPAVVPAASPGGHDVTPAPGRGTPSGR